MARIQILNLPAPADEYPFALVIDQWEGDPAPLERQLDGVRDAIGASGVLIFAGVVDVD